MLRENTAATDTATKAERITFPMEPKAEEEEEEERNELICACMSPRPATRTAFMHLIKTVNGFGGEREEEEKGSWSG